MLCDGWEYATAYDFMLESTDAGQPIVALPGVDDGDERLTYFSHPVTPQLEAYLYQEDFFERVRCLAVFAHFAAEHAPSIGDSADA